jgi:hypothetical protein
MPGRLYCRSQAEGGAIGSETPKDRPAAAATHQEQQDLLHSTPLCWYSRDGLAQVPPMMSAASRIAVVILASLGAAACSLRDVDRFSSGDPLPAPAEAGATDAAPEASQDTADVVSEPVDASSDPADGAQHDADAAADGFDADVGADSDALADTIEEALGDEPDTNCATEYKWCSGACVPIDDPAFGCGLATCLPCNSARATVECSAGQCSILWCDLSYGDCNSDPTDGCEIHLVTLDHCAQCNKVCGAGFAHATPTCMTGECKFHACEPGWADCDADDKTCEVHVASDVANCGACSVACSDYRGTAGCTEGMCTIACTSPYTDCDGDPDTGCEVDTDSDPDHCGSCAVKCASGKTCTGGNCQ